ncbi:MAG TPA: 6-bladed beta-propeller, partial [Algoriphagus sp.]|nr:6-bladed beta-propeller [Algoriphagus sp.]
VFDRAGNFISLIKADGEGPGKYLEFDDMAIVNDELLLTGVYPHRLMWFSLDGELLREEKVGDPIVSGIYSEEDRRYFFYYHFTEPGEYLVKSFNDSLDDSLVFLPFRQSDYYGNFSNRENFRKTDKIYLSRSFHDTVYVFEGRNFVPKLVFDYGEYRQRMEELARNRTNLDPLAELKFINERAKLYFNTHGWYITGSWLYSGFRYEKKSYNVFFNRKNRTTSVVDHTIKDDINEGFNPYSILYSFNENKVGNKIPGRDFFEILQKKKDELGKDGFEEYVKGKGKDFSRIALQAKDSENPVLIVYSVKK